MVPLGIRRENALTKACDAVAVAVDSPLEYQESKASCQAGRPERLQSSRILASPPPLIRKPAFFQFFQDLFTPIALVVLVLRGYLLTGLWP